MTQLQQANEALRQSRYEEAIIFYVRALQAYNPLTHIVLPNLKLAHKRYLKERSLIERSRVLVCGWDLARNAAGRVATLAQIYETFSDVEIIGCFFSGKGTELWPPIRNLAMPIHSILVDDERHFVEQAVELVLQHPCDLLHLSKPRFPNILIGLLYKLIWGSRVVVDIDDEELAFVSATEPLTLDECQLPNPVDLTGKEWTRIAVGLAQAFDSVTVVNPALQQRYGGTIVRHARDESMFEPSVERRQQSRTQLGITPKQKVVLFLGTPRAHKGLLETAQAIVQLRRNNVLFLVVGDFPLPLQKLKAEIESLPGLKTRLLGDQPFEAIPDILAAGDICVLLQNPESLAAQFQTPAKLSDALAMGLTVLAESTPALADLAEAGAFQPITRDTLAATLGKVLDQLPASSLSHPVFIEKLSLAANRPVLQALLAQTVTGPLSAPLQQLASCNDFGSILPLLFGPKKTAMAVPQSVPSPPPLTLPPENAEPGAYIQMADEAMGIDDWTGAYHCWKALFERQWDRLNISMLLRISRELFRLDAFTEASAVLNKAAAKDPNHPGVLCEQAQQYYYHCYSSWLMLVTENEPDWYKADGLDKRPDWQTACSLIEKAEKAAPRNNLRRYVQAYLLLAEEAWDKQQRTEAHAALRTALNAIGPNKLDKALIDAIFQAVDQFRDGKVDGKDPYHQTLQDQLKAQPLELLPVPDWLCLNDILNWNGLLLCGYVAREKAVDLALAQGKANPNNKEILKTALKAALDRNDTAQADDFLAKLKHISPHALDVRELDACCELMKGNLEGFRQKWPHPPTPAEQRLREYLKGKTVAVVGPAPTGSLDGEEIDGFDVVVRINWRGESKYINASEFGNNADISIYNAHIVRFFLKEKKTELLNTSLIALTRRFNYLAHELKFKSVCKIQEYPALFYKSFNAIQVAAFNLIINGASLIEVLKVSFYATSQHHFSGYRNEDKGSISTIRRLQPVLSNHDLISQYLFIRNLKATNALKSEFKYDAPFRYLAAVQRTLVSENESHENTYKSVCILTNGVIASTVALLVCTKLNIEKARIILFNKTDDVDFERAQIDYLRNNKFINIDCSNIVFLNDVTMKSMTSMELTSLLGNDVDLLLIPLSNHWIINFCAKSFQDAQLIMYEEGMGSYGAIENTNPIAARIKSMYFMAPEGMNPPKFYGIENVTIEKNLARSFFLESSQHFKQVIFSSKSALILGTSYSIYKMMEPDEELQSFVVIINKLISDGYDIYFKPHPRGSTNIQLILKEIYKSNIFIIEDIYSGVEFLMAQTRPNIVLGSISSSMFYLKYLFDLNCFTFDQAAKLPFNDATFHTKELINRRFDVYSKQFTYPKNKKANPLVSIIIPAYNVEDYIKDCIESVSNQTYTSLEIIIIDDGSTDRTSQIISNLAELDKRIRYIRTKNNGVSNARNYAYEVSKGDYFAYIDGDDWVHPDFVQWTLNVALFTKSDIVRNTLVTAHEDGKYYVGDQIKKFSLNSKVTNVIDSPFILTDMPISPCAGIYKKTNLTDNVRFPSGFRYEDIPYYWGIMLQFPSVAYIDSPFYYYRKRPNSTTTNLGLNNLDVLKSYGYIYDKYIKGSSASILIDSFYKSLERAIFVHMRLIKNTEYFEDFCLLANKLLESTEHSFLRRFDCFSVKKYNFLRKQRLVELKSIL